MNTLLITGLSLLLGLTGSMAHAGLSAIDDATMADTTGQAASISLGLDMRLNLDQASNGTLSNVCATGSVVACNLGVSFNNRYITQNGQRLKSWLVFKNTTAAITIPELTISGSTITVGGQDKAVLDIALSASQPIVIRKLGFDSLAVENDTAAEINSDGTLNLSNTPGYRNATLAPGQTTFDAGRGRGFIGLDMTATVAVNGNFKVFGCSSARC